MSDDSLVDMFDEAMSADTEETIEVEPVEADISESDADDTPEEESDGITDDVVEEDEAEVVDTTDEVPDEQEAEVDPDVYDWESNGDQLVTVKVQGENVTMPMREAFGGVMRQQDYSRKTAEIAEIKSAAQWALDVQQSFNDDADGTLQAFAKAYGIEAAQEIAQQAAPVADPYEAMDPEYADMMRAMDSKLAAMSSGYEEKIANLESQTGQITHQRLVQEAQAEMTQLVDQFDSAGYTLDRMAVLQTATSRNIPLTDAAAIWAGQQMLTNGQITAETEAKAEKAAADRAKGKSGKRKAAKKKASSTATESFDASDVSVDDFDSISDLFEIELNST